MTDAQFYNVMLLTAASQLLAIVFCAIAAFNKRLGKEVRELMILLWVVTTGLLPYLETGISTLFRGIMIISIVWGACTFAKYFRDDKRKNGFYIQLFITYIAGLGYLFAYLDRAM